MITFEAINWTAGLGLLLVLAVLSNLYQWHHTRGLQKTLHTLLQEGPETAKKVYDKLFDHTMT